MNSFLYFHLKNFQKFFCFPPIFSRNSNQFLQKLFDRLRDVINMVFTPEGYRPGGKEPEGILKDL